MHNDYYKTEYIQTLQNKVLLHKFRYNLKLKKSKITKSKLLKN